MKAYKWMILCAAVSMALAVCNGADDKEPIEDVTKAEKNSATYESYKGKREKKERDYHHPQVIACGDPQLHAQPFEGCEKMDVVGEASMISADSTASSNAAMP
jgi:hypothetical protein